MVDRVGDIARWNNQFINWFYFLKELIGTKIILIFISTLKGYYFQKSFWVQWNLDITKCWKDCKIAWVGFQNKKTFQGENMEISMKNIFWLDLYYLYFSPCYFRFFPLALDLGCGRGHISKFLTKVGTCMYIYQYKLPWLHSKKEISSIILCIEGVMSSM